MKNFLKKFNILFLLILIGFLGFIKPVFADEQNIIDVKYWDGDSYQILDGQPLFNEDNFLPGDIATSRIKITNKISSPTLIQIYGNMTAGDSEEYNLADMLNFKISDYETNANYYGGDGSKTMRDFFDESAGGIELTTISGGDSDEYLLTATFNTEADNDYQALETSFDLEIGFFGEVVSDEGNTGTSSGGGGGVTSFIHKTINIIGVGHAVSGSIDNLTENISWKTVDENNNNLATYGGIVYGETSISNSNLGDYPKYGYDYRINDDNSDKLIHHDVTATGLKSDTTYYYRILAWASPEIYSEEHSFTTALAGEEGGGEEGKKGENKGKISEGEGEAKGGEQDTEEEATPGTQEGTLATTKGISISGPGSSTEVSKEGEKKATTTQKETQKKEQGAGLLASLKSLLGDFGTKCFDCFPWWVLLILALYPLYRCCFTKKQDSKEFISWFAWTALHLVAAAILYLSGYLCLPLWVFIISALGTLLFWHTYAQDKKRAQKITLVGLILTLILLILLLILECLYLWLILFIILVFFSYVIATGGGNKKERQASLPLN